MLMFRIPVIGFLKAIKEPALIAFSTTSSEAALPRAMECVEAFGVPRRIVSFILPLGYSFNLDGSTLYLSLAAVFVAQAAGVELTVGQQITMMLTLMLTSKGVAGVPRAALVILAATLASYNLPLEGVTLILGVDAIMDMGRTMTNVVGNCLASVVVAKWEGEFRGARRAGFCLRRSWRAACVEPDWHSSARSLCWARFTRRRRLRPPPRPARSRRCSAAPRPTRPSRPLPRWLRRAPSRPTAASMGTWRRPATPSTSALPCRPRGTASTTFKAWAAWAA